MLLLVEDNEVNQLLCQALVDRLTDRAHILETGTESYRFRRTLAGSRSSV